ncbi:MAG: metallophosphoesterase family protein [Patescibacteria group bacterium]|nr:metallophosphoesterase family protein [Patescibacteria group bacterium]
MKIGILSDIHSNLEACKAVIFELEKKKIEKIWHLGDIVGYGPNPNECIELIRKKKIISLAGNHDLAVIKKIGVEFFNPYAALAIKINTSEISQENKKFLENLPLTLKPEENIILTHGSIRDPIWEYLMEIYQAKENFCFFQEKICFVGHSHLPMIFEKRDNKIYQFRFPPDKTFLKFEKNSRYIINPGSVGQPRDQNPKASFIIFDNEFLTLEYHRVEYDYQRTQEAMKSKGFHSFLIERLAIGY